MKSNNKNDLTNKDYQLLNALVDGELNQNQREKLLARLDQELVLRGELCDLHRIKDLMQFAYPLESEKKKTKTSKHKSYAAIATSFLLILIAGFIGGYFSSPGLKNIIMTNLETQAVTLPKTNKQNRVIIYLGSSEKEKFDETLDKAESLLNKYRNNGTAVYVVTSAGGIDLLRNNNTDVQQRIKKMKGLYATNLHFVACNNQIYQLHQKGHPVNLVDEVEVAPSAVQFVVDHLKRGWKYIAI